MWWLGSEVLSRQVLAVLLCKYLFPLLINITITEEDPPEHPRSHQPEFKPAFAVRKLLTDKNSHMKLRTILSCHEIAIESPDALIDVKRVHACAHEIFIHVLSTMTFHLTMH